MPNNSMMMIHKPWTLGYGNSNEFRKMADDLDKMELSILEAYKEHVVIDDSKLSELVNDETWMTAEEALEYGFIDEVIENQNEVLNVADVGYLKNYSKVPKCLNSALNETTNSKNEVESSLVELEKEKLKTVSLKHSNRK